MPVQAEGETFFSQGFLGRLAYTTCTPSRDGGAAVDCKIACSWPLCPNLQDLSHVGLALMLRVFWDLLLTAPSISRSQYGSSPTW